MKKIGIVTFQRALNYGALLQMYALQKFISKHFGQYNVEVLDYFSPLCEKECRLKNIKGKNIMMSILKKFNFLIKRYNFDEFIKKHINISKRYDIGSIQEAQNEYNVLITGSDQVWNPLIIGGDMNYLLKFSDVSVKASYAASIGKTELSLEDRDLYKKQLKQFKSISVREKSAQKLLEEFLESNNIAVNVDPTLLLSSDHWEKLAISKKRNRYLMVYQVKYSQALLQKAREFAQNKNLEVIYVGPFTKYKGIRYVPAPSVYILLGLFKNAEYVFTNSFHGTVFSIQFNRRFFVELQFSDGRNDRITDLLSVLHLTSRMDLSFIEQIPDWNYVNEQLEVERQRSLDYLRGVIEV